MIPIISAHTLERDRPEPPFVLLTPGITGITITLELHGWMEPAYRYHVKRWGLLARLRRWTGTPIQQIEDDYHARVRDLAELVAREYEKLEQRTQENRAAVYRLTRGR